jgi:hypothetical protein
MLREQIRQANDRYADLMRRVRAMEIE